MPKTKKKTKKDYTYAAGRRKTSSARVRLHKGNKESTVNDIVIGKYFPGDAMRARWQKPFDLTDTKGKYYITVKVSGGGKKGQLDAVVHATAKAFSSLDAKKFRSPLKKSGLLTRDDRIRERRMVGTGGKSRRQKQSPKR
jgi:small subunit ribosomal protein S9